MDGWQVPGIEQTVESFAHMLRAHGVHRASFVGHSFGSICVSWMVKHRPHLVGHSVDSSARGSLLCLD